MYRDNTLIPTEAVRLAALGALMERECAYGDLAREIRHFVGRVAGPSLDLLGTSLEVMCYEGLAELGGPNGTSGTLRITAGGRAQFRTLMTSKVRAPVNDVSKLVVALKMRFLHLLDRPDRLEQAELLREMCEGEAGRLLDLRRNSADGPFAEWLDFEIEQLERRIDWFRALTARL